MLLYGWLKNGIKVSGGLQTCATEGADAPRTSRQERRGVLENALITNNRCGYFLFIREIYQVRSCARGENADPDQHELT